MKVLRLRFFSNYTLNRMITKITERLDRDHINDYEVTDRVQNDVISILLDPTSVKIYVPEGDLEYYQYDIDDFIRSIAPNIRTNTRMEGDIYVMKLSGVLNENQLYRLVKYIIEETDFCSIIREEQ